jgi:hypothetical protein
MCLDIYANELYYSFFINLACCIFPHFWLLHILTLSIPHPILKCCPKDEQEVDYIDEYNF